MRFFPKKGREITKEFNPSQIRKNDYFSDGSIVLKKYFYDNEKGYIIFLNQNNEVKHKLKPGEVDSLDKVNKLSLIDGELTLINNLFRVDLNLQMAYVYKLAILNNINAAQETLDLLYNEVISRKKLLKKFVYLASPILLSILFYIISYLGNWLNSDFFKMLLKYNSLIIFSGIGNFLSISKNIDKIEFDSRETLMSYFIFAFFKYIHSSLSSILLIILYRSNLINLEVKNVNSDLFLKILVTIGSFCESLVPNIFDKIGNSLDKKES